jgi:hypothetical protein
MLLFEPGMRSAKTDVQAPSERAGWSSTIGAAWSLLRLRTDSVNRGFRISLCTLATVVLALCVRFCLFLITCQR